MKFILIPFVALLAVPYTSNLKITTVYTIAEGLPSNEVRAIFSDSDGSKWIGTGSGYTKRLNTLWHRDSRSVNPVVHGVSTIFKDSKGNFWFGGLNECHVLEDDTYTTYSIVEDMGIGGRVVFSFHEDQDQNIWIATTGGVSIYDGNGWSPFTTENGLLNNVVHDIDQDKDGNFWFATRKGGLNIFDGTNWKYLYPDMNCRKIFKDDLHNMWVGTNDGIIKFDGTNWQVFEEGKTVLPMFKGKKGFIWCIADGTDILRISTDGKTIEYQDPTLGLAGEIYQLEDDENGSVWAGTDHGLVQFH